MSTAPDPVAVIKTDEQQNTQKRFADPYEFLATVTGAPSKAQIEAWKAQTPNGRIRVFSPDGAKRVFLVRAVGGMELQRLQAQLPENLTPAKAEQEIQYLVSAACVLWTNNTNGRLSPDDLRNTSRRIAGHAFQPD
jgi:hypothetical protein